MHLGLHEKSQFFQSPKEKKLVTCGTGAYRPWLSDPIFSGRRFSVDFVLTIITDFSLTSLSRFHTLSTSIEKAENLEDISLLVDELEREMLLLSVSEESFCPSS